MAGHSAGVSGIPHRVPAQSDPMCAHHRQAMQRRRPASCTSQRWTPSTRWSPACRRCRTRRCEQRQRSCRTGTRTARPWTPFCQRRLRCDHPAVHFSQGFAAQCSATCAAGAYNGHTARVHVDMGMVQFQYSVFSSPAIKWYVTYRCAMGNLHVCAGNVTSCQAGWKVRGCC